jgi:hypothetical protein
MTGREEIEEEMRKTSDKKRNRTTECTDYTE